MAIDASRLPLPIPLLIFSQFLIIFAMSMPSATEKRLLFIPIMAISLFLVTKTTTGKPGADFGLGGIIMSHLFLSSDWLILSVPEVEFKQNSESKPIGLIAPYNFKTRLKWAFSLYINRRGIGWNFQVPHLPARPTMSRWRFIWSRLGIMVWCYLGVDLIQAYHHSSPIFRPNSPIPSIASDGFPWSVINVLSWAIAPYCVFRFQHALCSMITVATGIYQPSDWPDMFGSVLGAYTIRRFWSRTWHQILQRTFRSHGQFVARKVFRFSRGSLESAYTQLFVGFLVSAMLHHYGDYMMDPHHGGASFKFFLMQPIGIILEDGILAIASGLGWEESWKSKLLGYVWVFGWFNFLAIDWINAQVKAGVADEVIFPFSVVEGIWKGRWMIV